MFDPTTTGRGLGRRFFLAVVTAGSTLVGVSSALAGECPTDQMKADVRGRSHAAKGVIDKVLAAIDLEKEPAKIKDRQLRLRKLTIEPGGIVPWHSHDDRPAIIYIAEGEIVEYASNCAVPIVHKAGDISRRLSARRTGGRTSETRPSSCSSATCFTTRTTSTCDDTSSAQS